MRLSRRKFLSLAAAGAALPGFARMARAQAYPSHPVRIVVGFAPGGGTDIAARLLGQWLSERLGQQFVVENRPGAGGNIGAEAVVRAPADGYTLLLALTANAVNMTLYEKLNFNFLRDIVPVAGFSREANVLVVHPSVPPRTVPELIAFAKANPGQLNFASGGSGTTPHIAGELFKMMTGVNIVHVPYRGAGVALVDLLGGQVQVMFATLSSSIEYIRDGRLRPLAVTTATPSAALANVPPLSDFVPGYEASTWYGVGVPKNTPAEIVDKLSSAVNAVLADSRLEARLADLGSTALACSPAEFGKLIVDETEKWGKVVKFAGLRAD
jgi:tripartite-type tricarboxylate transporter receptor subunit TctC